jgi:predicted TIM-barrel fold metal-dependent hydrolase
MDYMQPLMAYRRCAVRPMGDEQGRTSRQHDGSPLLLYVDVGRPMQSTGKRSSPIFRRRTLLSSLAAAGGWELLGGRRLGSASPQAERRYRIWDAHCHLHGVPGNTPEQRIEVLIRAADRLGIERIVLSQGYSEPLHPSPEQLREENDRVLRAVRRFPNRVFGSVYVSPSFPDLSRQEFDRCVRDGPMVAVGEIEADKRCNVREMDAVVERAASLKAPILQHTWLKAEGNEPGESTPYDLVELARRHPDATFICGHTGGNWELGIRIIRDTPNILAEIAGFDPTAGVLEMAVRELGPDRVVFGSDGGGRSFASQVAKVMGADIPDSAKELALGGNLRRLLSSILRAKGYPV